MKLNNILTALRSMANEEILTNGNFKFYHLQYPSRAVVIEPQNIHKYYVRFVRPPEVFRQSFNLDSNNYFNGDRVYDSIELFFQVDEVSPPPGAPSFHDILEDPEIKKIIGRHVYKFSRLDRHPEMNCDDLRSIAMIKIHEEWIYSDSVIWPVSFNDIQKASKRASAVLSEAKSWGFHSWNNWKKEEIKRRDNMEYDIDINDPSNRVRAMKEFHNIVSNAIWNKFNSLLSKHFQTKSRISEGLVSITEENEDMIFYEAPPSVVESLSERVENWPEVEREVIMEFFNPCEELAEDLKKREEIYFQQQSEGRKRLRRPKLDLTRLAEIKHYPKSCVQEAVANINSKFGVDLMSL